MKTVSLAFVAVISFTTGAFAQSRPQTIGMNCSLAQSLVANRGAVVLSTGQNTFDRYVSSQASCLSGEFTRPAWVPTADTPQCFIGYTCVVSEPDVG
ncbi:hypothetical protein DC522_15320 [Microvirga sp. KLBC 81]|nr:hypothetical protein DC522_15320 [Microvirga sp. KLBC 81]